jgi:hypothetical protein
LVTGSPCRSIYSGFSTFSRNFIEVRSLWVFTI